MIESVIMLLVEAIIVLYLFIPNLIFTHTSSSIVVVVMIYWIFDIFFDVVSLPSFVTIKVLASHII